MAGVGAAVPRLLWNDVESGDTSAGFGADTSSPPAPPLDGSGLLGADRAQEDANEDPIIHATYAYLFQVKGAMYEDLSRKAMELAAKK